MNVANLCLYADGYYSGSSYEENVLISEELYNKIQDKIGELKIYIPDLDGKYSEVLGSIVVQRCKELDIPEWYKTTYSNGDYLYNKIREICDDIDCDLDEDCVEVDKYIESLDHEVDVLVTVKKSNVEKLKEYAESLR